MSYLEENVAALFWKTKVTAIEPPRLPRDTLYPQWLALTWPTSGGSSMGVVRSRTKATDLFNLK
jgi:hypothetical protein